MTLSEPVAATTASLQGSPAARGEQDLTALDSAESGSRCPTCGRGDALLVLDEVVYCAACGYASDGARGCT